MEANISVGFGKGFYFKIHYYAWNLKQSKEEKKINKLTVVMDIQLFVPFHLLDQCDSVE